MEPSSQDTVTLPAKTIPVMDIQPPATTAPVPPASAESVEAVAPAVESPEVVSAPAEEAEPAGSESPDAATDSPADEAPTMSSTPPAPSPMAVTPDNAGRSHRVPTGAITAAILIALILAGATIFAYLRSTKNDTATLNSTKSNTATQPTQQKPIQAADVDATNQGLDDSLKAIDENKDFASTDLSDTTLGL